MRLLSPFSLNITGARQQRISKVAIVFDAEVFGNSKIRLPDPKYAADSTAIEHRIQGPARRLGIIFCGGGQHSRVTTGYDRTRKFVPADWRHSAEMGLSPAVEVRLVAGIHDFDDGLRDVVRRWCDQATLGNDDIVDVLETGRPFSCA